MLVNRGCIVHGKNVGLDGDKTSTGAFCIATRTGFTVMGKLKLYIGDKTSPCPKCGQVGTIVSGDHRQTNGVAVAVDGAEIHCGCPGGSHFLIAPGVVSVPDSPMMMPVVSRTEPEQHAQAAKKKKREITLTIGVFFDGTGNNADNSADRQKACTGEHFGLNDADAQSALIQCTRLKQGYSGTAAGSHLGYYTNVHWLNTLYNQKITPGEGDGQHAIYIEGIGTESGDGDWPG